MIDYIEQGICPDCEDPHGFDTCSECGSEAEGVYDDTGFFCYECCWREAERTYDQRYERAPIPDEEFEMPF